jgi:hypothetical protein
MNEVGPEPKKELIEHLEPAKVECVRCIHYYFLYLPECQLELLSDPVEALRLVMR